MVEFFPNSAIIAQIGPIAIRFYGAMYALTAILAYAFIRFFTKKKNLPLTKDHAFDLVFYAFLGGILGARIFYVLVYNFEYFVSNPFEVIAVWRGGMSIHGGLLGGAGAVIWYIQKKKLPMWEIGKMAAVIIPLGMMLGRLGNFMNGELPGRVTDVPWAMDFGDGEFRHPSQLYAVGKDFILFTTFFLLALKSNIHGKILFGMFLVNYAIFRFVVEFFREPDPQLGFLVSWLTMGQVLSVGVFAVGLVVIKLSFQRSTKHKIQSTK